MSYQKLNLDNGNTLLAEHLQHIENGIESAHIRQPLTFTGAVTAKYDGSQEVTVRIPSGGSGDNGYAGFEVLIDFTTTEDVLEFQIPVDDTEIADKIKNSPIVYIGMDIPRDAADTETSTVGTIDVSLYASWKQALFAKIPAISPPNVTWAKNGRVSMMFNNVSWATEGQHQRMPLLKSYAAVIENYSPNGAKCEHTYSSVNPWAYITDKSYFIITGTQNLVAGTRFILGVLK